MHPSIFILLCVGACTQGKRIWRDTTAADATENFGSSSNSTGAMAAPTHSNHQDESITGVWIRKRNFIPDRVYDVVQSDDGSTYEAFPITSCRQNGEGKGLGITTMWCDSFLRLHVADGVVTKSKVWKNDDRVLQITDCGVADAVGVLKVKRFYKGRPEYMLVGDEQVIFRWSDRKGWLLKVGGKTKFYHQDNVMLLPTSGWEASDPKYGQPPVFNSTSAGTNFTYQQISIANCGTARANGQFVISGDHDGRPEYSLVDDKRVVISWSDKSKSWRLFIDEKNQRRQTLYQSLENQYTVPTSGWTVLAGDAPAPDILGVTNEIYRHVATAVLFGQPIVELKWNDGAKWVRYSGPENLIHKWDRQCSAGKGYSPVQKNTDYLYSTNFVLSLSLTYSNIPGLNFEFVQCFNVDWLRDHMEKLQCIMNQSSAEQSEIEMKLQQIESLLPPRKGASCIPTVCLGLVFPIFPIPSPIPTVFLMALWPHHLETCNGVSLHDQIEQKYVKKAPRYSSSHGIHNILFPIPAISYITTGAYTFPVAKKLKKKAKKIDWDSIEDKRHELDLAINVSLAECPFIKRRFDLHKRSNDNTWHLLDNASPEVRLRTIAALFPELGGGLGHQNREVGMRNVNINGFFFIGTAGVTAGIGTAQTYGGKSFVNTYRGCVAWGRVIKLWAEHPVLQMNHKEEQDLKILEDVEEEALD